MEIINQLNRKLTYQWLLPVVVAVSFMIGVLLLAELALFAHSMRLEIVLALGIIVIVILLLWIFKQQRVVKTAYGLGNYDPITGSPNRDYFYEFLDKQLEQADQEQSQLALLFMDIDQFKSINERYGYEYGDELLKKIGKILQRTVLPSGLAVRFAGDEFLALIPQTDQEQAQQIVASLVSHCQKPVEIDGHTIKVTVSVGIAMYPFHAGNRTTLLQHANAALNQAKNRGRNNYQFFIQTLFETRKRSVSIEQQLRFAIDNDELNLNFHPIMRVEDEELVGLEVLLRWYNKELGQVPPDEFIQVAEASGLIADLDYWVLTTACRQFREWQEQVGDINLYLSLNCSTVQLQGDKILPKIKQILEDTQVDPAKLIIEVTETAVMERADEAIQTLQQINDLGIKIAVDDFGTGYSSFDYLKRLPVALLKIDKSFISDLESNQADREIVQAMVKLASTLNMATIAEGVETRQELDYLAQYECAYAQGFYFTKPMDQQTTQQYLLKYFEGTNDNLG